METIIINDLQRELIPGFPFQEFEGSSNHTEYWNDFDIKIIGGKLFRPTSQKTLKFLRSLPLELQEHVFYQIIDQNVPDPRKYAGMSPDLALNWVQNTEDHNELSAEVMANGLISLLPNHWGRYRLRIESYKKRFPRKGAGRYFEGLDIGDSRKLDSPAMNSWKTMSTWESDSLKQAIDLSKSVENDYIIVRSYDELLEFSKAIAHAEGFTLKYENLDGSCVPRWKSSNKNSILLRDLLKCFWRELELDFTCESRKDIPLILHSPGAFSWISALQSLPVSDKFRLLYLPTREVYQLELDPWDRKRYFIKCMDDDAEANFWIEKELRERLMPATLNQ